MELVQIANGWLAVGEKPRLAGFGRTPEEAEADFTRLKDVFERCLERGAQSSTKRHASIETGG